MTKRAKWKSECKTFRWSKDGTVLAETARAWSAANSCGPGARYREAQYAFWKEYGDWPHSSQIRISNRGVAFWGANRQVAL